MKEGVRVATAVREAACAAASHASRKERRQLAPDAGMATEARQHQGTARRCGPNLLARKTVSAKDGMPARKAAAAQ